MLLNESELILEVIESKTIRNEPVVIAMLRGGKALAVSRDTIALYKDLSSIDDPLGGGLIGMADIPERARWQSEVPTITSYRSGLITFNDKKVIFITPKSFRLYANSQDALHNVHLVCELIHNS